MGRNAGGFPEGLVGGESETAGPSGTLPRISCRAWWLWQTSCAFLYGKPYTWSRGRKSGYASVGMTKFRAATYLEGLLVGSRAPHANQLLRLKRRSDLPIPITELQCEANLNLSSRADSGFPTPCTNQRSRMRLKAARDLPAPRSLIGNPEVGEGPAVLFLHHVSQRRDNSWPHSSLVADRSLDSGRKIRRAPA
jgi:hypothetical protein